MWISKSCIRITPFTVAWIETTAPWKQERRDDADRAIRRLGDGDYDLGIQRLEMFDDFSSELRDLNRERKEAERSGDKAWSRAVEAERKAVFAEFNALPMLHGSKSTQEAKMYPYFQTQRTE